MIPKKSENPDGLHQRYKVAMADGSECDPRAVYFVLRLDPFGDDQGHIEACREAAYAYCDAVQSGDPIMGHLAPIGADLRELIRSFS